jgi:large subunit ribosomal protein L15
LPIIKRLPRKRGFYNLFRVAYSPVNVGSLNIFEAGTEITAEMLFKTGLVDSLTRPVKILADGELKNAVTVKANKFSEAAKAKIEAAGGKVEEI